MWRLRGAPGRACSRSHRKTASTVKQGERRGCSPSLAKGCTAPRPTRGRNEGCPAPKPGAPGAVGPRLVRETAARRRPDLVQDGPATLMSVTPQSTVTAQSGKGDYVVAGCNTLGLAIAVESGIRGLAAGSRQPGDCETS